MKNISSARCVTIMHTYIGYVDNDIDCVVKGNTMPIVVGIRFKDSGKTYYFDPTQTDAVVQGQYVIVETARGLEMARVSELPHEVEESAIVGELKPVIRHATPEDDVRWKQLNSRQDELIKRCQEKIDEHELPMGLVKAEYSFDGSRLTFYFTADKRVDFRNLVRDLARTFRTRIELRQIGPRDEAKLLGGIGPCGRILCCATFLPDYARVSIKMAKDQDLPLNPSKISGVCGRLLCCLAYEHEQYIEMKAEMPRRGMWVQTPEGPGEVVNVNVLRSTVTVLLSATGVSEEFSPQVIQETTNEVANQAKARNAEGITPAVSHQRNRGERRLLREEFESSDMLAALAALEDKPDEQARGDDIGAAVRQKPTDNRRDDNRRDDRRNAPPMQDRRGPDNRPTADRRPGFAPSDARSPRPDAPPRPDGPPRPDERRNAPFTPRLPQGGERRPDGPPRNERFVRPDAPARSDNPVREERFVRPDAPARSDNPVREERVVRPDAPARSDNPVREEQITPPTDRPERPTLQPERRRMHPDGGNTPARDERPARDNRSFERPAPRPRDEQRPERPALQPERRSVAPPPTRPTAPASPDVSSAEDQYSVPQVPPVAQRNDGDILRRRRRKLGGGD